MTETENFSTFFKENKKLVKEYLDTKLEIFRLRAIRIFSKSSGYLLWIVISLMLLLLLFVFLGLVSGFWLSGITGSYTKGFGITTLIILAVIIILALFRRVLFINPIIRSVINHANEATHKTEEDEQSK